MNETQWISVKDQAPIPGEILVIFDNWEHGYLLWGVCDLTIRRQVRYWMPFPKDPPKPDAFEEFWGTCGKAGGQEGCRYVGWAEESPVVAPIFKSIAKVIWDAAVAATKKEK